MTSRQQIHNIAASIILAEPMRQIRDEVMVGIRGYLRPSEEDSRLFVLIEKKMRESIEVVLASTFLPKEGQDDLVSAFIKEYKEQDLCAAEFLAGREVPAGLTVEEAFNLYIRVMETIEKDRFIVLKEGKEEPVTAQLKKFLATGIVFETDDEVPDIPQEMTVMAESEEGVADAISDETGWLVKSIGEIREIR